ncbi:MAG: hypothetical protein [Bacteriophage sp.]|nr:MAG: hypothetical protein [Bacteriophage sp.]
MFQNKLVVKKKLGKNVKVILDLTEGVIDSFRPNIVDSNSIKSFIFDNLELLRNLDIKENVINQLKNKVNDVITDELVENTKARNFIVIFETVLEIKESFSDNKFELIYKLEIGMRDYIITLFDHKTNTTTIENLSAPTVGCIIGGYSSTKEKNPFIEITIQRKSINNDKLIEVAKLASNFKE